MKIAILADDLTGAADAAAPFAALGWHAAVQGAGSTRGYADLKQSAVIAWNSQTRDLPTEQSARIRRSVLETMQRLREREPDIWFKKIDSTLRGNLRPELDAMRSVLPNRIAVVCPAYPVNGRAVLNGRLHIHGNGLGSVREAFSMQNDSQSCEVWVEELRRLGSGLASYLASLLASGIHTVFCDGESTTDLELIAGALSAITQETLPVGSAGLAAAISKQLPVPRPRLDTAESALESLQSGRVLVIVGSRNPVSRVQARVLSARFALQPVELQSGALCEDHQLAILNRFGSGERIVLAISPDNADPKYILPLRLQSKRFIETVPDIHIVVTGGDTAMAVITEMMDSSRIEIGGEFEPGIVFGRLHSTEEPDEGIAGLPIVLKAGGFGDKSALVRCLGL